jgi:thiamine monophosphate kinase
MGLFWAAMLRRLNTSIQFDSAYKNLVHQVEYRPAARIREGVALGKSKLLTSCIDSSDGVIGCLRELAVTNNVDIILEGSRLDPHPIVKAAAQASKIDPRKLMLSWGDWQLVCTASAANVEQAVSLVRQMGTPCYDIGHVVAGKGEVLLEEDGMRKHVTNFASERFAATSFFTHGLEAYVQVLRDQPFTVEP